MPKITYKRARELFPGAVEWMLDHRLGAPTLDKTGDVLVWAEEQELRMEGHELFWYGPDVDSPKLVWDAWGAGGSGRWVELP